MRLLFLIPLLAVFVGCDENGVTAAEVSPLSENKGISLFALALIASILAVGLVAIRFAFSCFKRCTSDRVLVVYGLGIKGSGRCIHGKTSFVWPILQDHQFLDLTPIPIDIKLVEGLSKDGIKVMVVMTCTIGIATETGVVEKAAERLLGLDLNQLRLLGQDIILEEMPAVIASLKFEPNDRNLLVETSAIFIQAKLKEIGLRLININIQRVSRTTKDGEVEMGGD